VNETKVRGLKILLVDSDYDFLQVLSQFLSTEGYEIIVAHDGEEGLNKALVESPDLIVLEPMLSKIHGFTLCGMISREFKKNIPVIIVSQHYDDENCKKEALRTHGASAYLVRPITKSELRAVIDDVLRSNPQEPDEDKPVENEHPNLTSEADEASTQVKIHRDKETEAKSGPQEIRKNKDYVNIEELLASEGIIVKKPKEAKTNPLADKENGAMKKIGAILNTEISFNKIRDRLRSAVENEEISSVHYKERIIPGTNQDESQLNGKEEKSEETANRNLGQNSDVNNNGNEPRKKAMVDEMLNDIMNEFGLSGTNAEHRS